MNFKIGKFRLRVGQRVVGNPWGYARSNTGIYTNIAGRICDLTWH